MKKLLNILALCLIASGSFAQTVITRDTQTVGLGSPDWSTNGIAGTFRFTFNVKTTGTNVLDFTDGDYTFRLDVFDTNDGFRASTGANTTTPEINPAIGQVRFVTASLNARGYIVKAIAIPTTDTNAAFPIAWFNLVVTNAPSLGVVSISLDPLTDATGHVGNYGSRWGAVHAVDGIFSNLAIGGTLDVGSAITAVDTGRVSKLGDTATGPITGTTFHATSFFGSGANLTGIPQSTNVITSVTTTGPVHGAVTIAAGTGVLITQTDTVFNVAASAAGGAPADYVSKNSNNAYAVSTLQEVDRFQVNNKFVLKNYHTNAAGQVILEGHSAASTRTNQPTLNISFFDDATDSRLMISPSMKITGSGYTADEVTNKVANDEGIALIFGEGGTYSEVIETVYADGAATGQRMRHGRYNVSGNSWMVFNSVQHFPFDFFVGTDNSGQSAFGSAGTATPQVYINGNYAYAGTTPTGNVNGATFTHFSVGKLPVIHAMSATTSTVFGGYSRVNSAMVTTHGDMSLGSTGQKIWLSTNEYLTGTGTGTIARVSLTPATTVHF